MFCTALAAGFQEAHLAAVWRAHGRDVQAPVGRAHHSLRQLQLRRSEGGKACVCQQAAAPLLLLLLLLQCARACGWLMQPRHVTLLSATATVSSI
jgi:hypothetical protein